MPWPLILGGAAIGVWAVNKLVDGKPGHEELQSHQQRLVFALLRLLEASPGGLISVELKICFCEYLSTGFRTLANNEDCPDYRACADSADAQIEILRQRQPARMLPHFDDDTRIAEAQQALPRFQDAVIKLRQQRFLSARDSQRFLRQLSDRTHELEMDRCLLRAASAFTQSDGFGAQRHVRSARSAIEYIRDKELREAQSNYLEDFIQRHGRDDNHAAAA